MRITYNQYIQYALILGIPETSNRFFRTKFDNVYEDHVANFRGELNRNQMLELKGCVDELVNRYNTLMSGVSMSAEESDLAKVMYIHSYLLGSVRYSECYFVPGSSNVYGGNPYKNSFYGAVVMNDAVCSGISEAFDCLCKVMGVSSTKLLSLPNDPWGGGHAFNSVKIGNNWYKVDVTLTIGMNPGHKFRGSEWIDRNFLVPFGDVLASVCVPSVEMCDRTYS